MSDGYGETELLLSESLRLAVAGLESGLVFLLLPVSLFLLLRLRSEYKEPLVMGKGDWEGVTHFLTGD